MVMRHKEGQGPGGLLWTVRHSQQICSVPGLFKTHRSGCSHTVPVGLGISLHHKKTSCLWVLAPPAARQGLALSLSGKKKSLYHFPAFNLLGSSSPS